MKVNFFEFPNHKITIKDESPTFDEQIRYMQNDNKLPQETFIEMIKSFKSMMSINMHKLLIKWSLDTIKEWDEIFQGPDKYPKVKKEIQEHL